MTIASIGRSADIEPRDAMIGKLDFIRDQYESSRLNRIRYMVQARRDVGMSCHEIGIILGITENAVRQAIRKADGLD